MPIRSVARAAVLVASVTAAFLALPCLAAEADATVESTTVVPASHNLFTSWFSGRTAAETVADLDPAVAITSTPSAASRAGDLVIGALGLLGISYRTGGSSPASGFDCSGMVRYVFQNTLGLSLPRRAEEISRVGMKISRNELKPGDLVFYKTIRRAVSHVGIYLGNNRFIHAPSPGGAVRVDDMTEGYWATRFTGARRVDG